jgi:hypothetical protein
VVTLSPAVTSTVTEVVPTLTTSALEADPLGTVTPFTMMIAVDDAAVGVTVMVVVPFGTVAVYVMVFRENAGLRVPVDIARPLNVASLPCALDDPITGITAVSHPNTAAASTTIATRATRRIRVVFALRTLRMSVIRIRPHGRMAECVDGGLDDFFGAHSLYHTQFAGASSAPATQRLCRLVRRFFRFRIRLRSSDLSSIMESVEYDSSLT